MSNLTYAALPVPTRAVLFVGLALALMPVAASAQSRAVVFAVSGQGTAEQRATAGEMLTNAVRANTSLELVERPDLDISTATELYGCPSPTAECMADLATTLEAERVLAGQLVTEEGGLALHVRYFDAALQDFLIDRSFDFSSVAAQNEVELRLAALISNRTVVQVSSSVQGTEVFLDGEPQGTAPLALIDLSPGRYTLTATCASCTTVTRIIQVQAGRYYSEVVEPEAEGQVAELPPGSQEPEDDSPGNPYVWPTVTISTGGALLLTGVTMGILTKSTQSDFDDTTSFREAQDLADKGDTYALLTNVFIGVGAAAVVGGIIWLLLTDPEEPQSTDEDVAFSNVRTTPWFGAEGAGLSLDWRF
ncbi:MAG: PEGA domain-containing protein [Myxococcales bacterium]|nr:PEGA domain-containing protein [Myxococcales bacterium]